jgi:hypothetical protein
MIAYEGQPTTCFGRGEEGHLFQGCPHRRREARPMDTPMRKMYADAAAASTANGAPGPDYGATDSTKERKATHPGDTAGGQERAEWAQADKAQER